MTRDYIGNPPLTAGERAAMERERQAWLDLTTENAALKARLAEAERLLHELADGRVGDALILNPVARIRAYFAARAADSAPVAQGESDAGTN